MRLFNHPLVLGWYGNGTSLGVRVGSKIFLDHAMRERFLVCLPLSHAVWRRGVNGIMASLSRLLVS